MTLPHPDLGPAEPGPAESSHPPVESPLQAVDSLRSADGWLYASSASIDADDPGRYHCLFGRDSLITALQVLPARPEIAADTLRALAALRGTIDDPETDEQPGRILHEYRPTAPQYLIDAGWPVRNGELRYYGSSDAGSWFLHLLDATGDVALQEELADARRDVADWLERALAEGRGFVRCGGRRGSATLAALGGLEHQGWRDAQSPADDPDGGGIFGPDLTAPTPPLADADSQAAGYAGLRALARLEPGRAQHWTLLADRLQARIAAAFTPSATSTPIAVDGHDRPVQGAGSQLGWLLWSGALTGAAASAAAQRLLQPDLLTRYGVRTLATSEPAYRPDGYHRGAIWPFDNWFAWGGLRAIGHPAADVVRDGVRAGVAQLGRYPELYIVDGHERITASPLSNRIQAWTAGAMAAFDADWTGRLRG